jgi:hypothetical protein
VSTPEKITLFTAERPDLKIFMGLYFKEDGSLFFDGYDTGTFVKQTFGSSDYEYSFTVRAGEVEKFYTLFDIPTGNRQILLNTLKDRFGHNEGYSQMTTYMTDKDITFERFIWH